MKPLAILLLAIALPATAAESTPRPILDSSLQARVGFDSNPDGTSGSAAAILGDAETLTYGLGANVALTLPGASADRPVTKFTYAVDAFRFDRWSGEDFSTHRFGWTGQTKAGAWKLAGDASSLFVAGSKDTLTSVTSVNANAISIWRERRRQWQHRLKLQAQAELGAWVVRGSGTVLAYDYQTRVVAGKVAFADRSDAQAGVEIGRRQSAGSLWLAGIRAGHQEQAIVPLPNCEFDYSSDYTRLSAGWEGQPFAGTSLTVAAGPDFRHYSGAIDSRVWSNGRDRTSLWFESALSSKLTKTMSLTAKAVRMAWLSSTGKSAYTDSSAEATLAWAASPLISARLTGKVHRCDYFPTVRDDWESLLGAGLSLKVSNATVLTVDVTSHRAWNNLDAFTEREFRRSLFSLGLSAKL